MTVGTVPPRAGQSFRGWRWLLLLAGILMLGVAVFVHFFIIIVTVENVGVVPIESVKIEMSGKVYDLGEIEPGESEIEFTYPTGESVVLLHWMRIGVAHETLIGGYVNLLLSGTIKVKVNEDKVVGLSGSRAFAPR